MFDQSKPNQVRNIISKPSVPELEAKTGQIFLIRDGHYMLSYYRSNYYLLCLETGEILDSAQLIQALVRAYSLSHKNLRKNLTFCQ